MGARRIQLGCLLVLGCLVGCQGAGPFEQVGVKENHYYYRPRLIGSESLFNPVTSFTVYSLDSLQIDKFGTSHFAESLDTVVDNIWDPINTIRDDGGTKSFINTQIFPVDPDNLGDSEAILPNVALHMFGGGIIYRKNAEWFEAHGFPLPYLTSGVLSMITEVIQEAIEKPATTPTDEVADILLFRPLGLWLFSNDEIAKYFKQELNPVDWPYLLAWDTGRDRLINVGLNYVVRPDWLWTSDTRVFAHVGLTNLFGLSHRVSGEDSISWGIGASTETVQPTTLHTSAGIFYDRDDSLLASLIVEGTEDLVVRTNIYPGVLLPARYPLGVFVGVRDDGDVTVGIQWGLPVAIAR